MKVSVRRKSRPLRAASEFFHAGLTFLCAHCIVGSLLAPAMRLFFAGLCPTCEWVKAAGPEWAALEAAGGAGWPSWTAWSAMLMPDVDGGDDATDGGEVCKLLSCSEAVREACVLNFSFFLRHLNVGKVRSRDGGTGGGCDEVGMMRTPAREKVYVSDGRDLWAVWLSFCCCVWHWR